MARNNARNGHDAEYYRNRMTSFGKVAWATRAFRVYPNCDGIGVLYNWWHPVAWVITFLEFLSIAFMGGADAVAERWTEDRFGYGWEKYFQQYPHLKEFVPHTGNFKN